MTYYDSPTSIHPASIPSPMQRWEGTLISEILLSGGSLCLFAIFVLIIIYWADLLKKVSCGGIHIFSLSPSPQSNTSPLLSTGFQASTQAWTNDNLFNHHGILSRIRGTSIINCMEGACLPYITQPISNLYPHIIILSHRPGLQLFSIYCGYLQLRGHDSLR